ncbi:MAG: MTAP family purine nucleoside phosphorylase [Gammaproteobacteria bacterium]
MLAVIGGSGFYQLANGEQKQVSTPFGDPSGPVTICDGALFLARHGAGHRLLPSEINYRANIWALKSLGARRIIAVSAAGSLRHKIAPGDFILPSQYFDHTRGRRASTFFGDGLVAHVSSAESSSTKLRDALAAAAAQLGYQCHNGGIYACVEGPRLGTRAESFFLRDAIKADIVGMTNIPEVFLAREAQLSYATLAIATDYDCWLDDPAQHVTTQMVIQRFGESIAKAREMINSIIASPPQFDEEDEKHRRALAEAVLTPPEAQSAQHKKILEVLRA